MPLGTDPNDIYHNGRWYDRSGRPIDTERPVVFRGSWVDRPTADLAVGDGAFFDDFAQAEVPWAWSGARWVPTSPVKIFQNNNLITGLAQTADQILISSQIPAGVLTGLVFAYDITLARDSTTDAFGTQTALRCGLAGTVADALVGSANFSGTLTATNRSLGVSTWSRASSATSIVKLGTANAGPSFAALGSGGVANTAVTVPDLNANAVFLSWSTTMAGATSKPQVGYATLTLYP